MIMIYKHKLIKIKINKDKLNKLHTQVRIHKYAQYKTQKVSQSFVTSKEIIIFAIRCSHGNHLQSYVVYEFGP